MKKKETTIGGSVKECDVSSRIKSEDNPTKRQCVENRVPNGDNNNKIVGVIVVPWAQAMKSKPLGYFGVLQP
jgi:hypothetical protein